MSNGSSWHSLIPVIVAVLMAIVSRRPIESLVTGVVMGLLLLEPSTVAVNFSAILLRVLMDETVAWVIIVCGLMGSLITLMMRAGAAIAFSELLSRHARSARSALLYTWLLGLIIFIDDYLNALAVGCSMRKLTDRYGVSREKLAYVVDSTAAPICVLIPVSTWSVFFTGVLESSGAADPGEGVALYLSAIPFMVYPWIAALMVPLVAAGRIPDLGLMRAAEKRVAASDSADASTDRAGGGLGSHIISNRARVYHFVFPFLCMLGFTLWFDLDVQTGVTIAVTLTVLLYGAQGLMGWGEAFDSVLDGVKTMVPALTIVVVAFMFKEVNDDLGLPYYVIETVTPHLTTTLLPVAMFVTMAFISFATGSSWGVFAIAIPIVMPLAATMSVPAPLAVGALISASAFGSHACFYSDSTVLAAQGSGCGVMEHALTQIPYALIAAVLSGLVLTVLTAL